MFYQYFFFKIFMRLLIQIIVLIFFSSSVYSQTEISGTISDAATGELLIGATVIYGKGEGVSTDLDGYFSFKIQKGERNLKVSYVGYEEINEKIIVANQPITLEFKLKTVLLNEVQVVADIAIDRKTPVAFSTIPLKKIDEELASQDIPLVLNSTPGVYATQSGGGDGDARITIRGFNQRNVAVMIDGIPVNDMENGWVYWSNWFGLDAVTSNIQIQRGLGASKIAIPSVGGTMNILTKGTGTKKGGVIKQEVGSFGKSRTTVGYNSGKSENGWGYTLAGSYKNGDGFVDQTWTQGYFYYAKLQKELNNHILSFSVMGAPQKHGQRSYKSDIATYDTTFARELGDTSSFENRITNKGIRYNKHWGVLDRWEINSNNDTTHALEILNTKQNYYHKPQFALRDFWTVNKNLYISNILYSSIGSGGGTGLSGNTNNYDITGQYNLQESYNANKLFIDGLYSNEESKANTYLRSSINNHFWYGGLSTLTFRANDKVEVSAGIDLRYYKGEHYREVYDLLGGDYAIDEASGLQETQIKRKGDIVGYHNDGIVKWAGGFWQLEYSDERISTFLNFSAANSAYKRIDYFKKKDLVFEDTTYVEAVGRSVNTEPIYDNNGILIGAQKSMIEDTIWHKGNPYTMHSSNARLAETNWKWIDGYTIKSGININLTERINTFFNIGYITKAPRFNNVFDYSNQLFRDIKNEKVKAFEYGYAYRSRNFSFNLNSYYTKWENKPSSGGVTVVIDEIPYKANINGMDALHKGIELDFAYNLTPKFKIEGLASLGVWKWTSQDTVRFYDDNNQPILDEFTGEEVMLDFDARGVYVGDAAQTQLGLSVRYEPTKNIYLKLRSTYFSDYYADFDPISLGGINGGRQSWKIPAYKLVDLHCGYTLKLNFKNKIKFRLSILNLFNELYISDAQNNDPYNAQFTDFDAKSAGVFFGLGRRFNFATSLTF